MDLIAHPPSPVDIIEVCRVTPSPCSSPEQQSLTPHSLPLTFFDLLWLRFHPIQRLFFYQDTAISSLDAILPKLKTSLSLALRRYLPLAGNLLWPRHSVVPTVEFVEGDAVLLTVVESDADFHHLSSNGFRDVVEYHPLVPELSMSHDRVAVIALQVTVFRNRGFSIGITIHHAVMDGRTSASFVNSWACICNTLQVTGESSIPIATYERTLIEDPISLTEIYLNAWLNQEGPNNRSLNIKLPKISPTLIRCTLELSPQNIQKLKQQLLKQQQQKSSCDSHNSYISSFVAATAYLCVCMAKTEGLKEGKLAIAFPADVRARLNPLLPSNYFGNCLVPRYALMERSEILSENNGAAVAGEAIFEAIRSLEEGVLTGAEEWRFIIDSSNRAA
ncbi:phenolic glucoside malonyltransferase 2-like [Momordica charantia]|uniref:Phenolic glucoside malonyltransferase 2-like n=1 Tax=Momordica charantia TaxID=3673 RepID=A0A6J1CPT2_MOMCH|nr:phenolic glucoside malonyltransferase 2-like [Momordica charantia]